MPRALRWMQVGAVLLAAGLAAAPLPGALVERYYARAFYPALQARLTSWSNTTAWSLFDVVVLFAATGLLILWMRALGAARRARPVRQIGGAAWSTLVIGAGLYLWFSVGWGLNYARPPIESAIGYDAARVTDGALRALADRAANEANAGYAPAQGAGFPAMGEMPPALVRSFHALEQRLGRPRPTTPGRPKRTLLAPFFRSSGVDGMHAPFLLETLLNPDLTPPERPAVLAHEWAHLSGYAPEAEASFVGLLAAAGADPASRYSAWLTIVSDVAAQLPADDRKRLIARLDAGPQADLRAIAQRISARVDVVATVSWRTYDQYLKAQGVSEGVQSYSRVVQLLLGSNALEWR